MMSRLSAKISLPDLPSFRMVEADELEQDDSC